MSLPVIIRPQAKADDHAICADLEAVRSGLGGRFVDRLRDTLERIEAMPLLYGVIDRDIRAALLRKFRHVVYYIAFQDRVEVLAVLHGARDPSIWRRRR